MPTQRGLLVAGSGVALLAVGLLLGYGELALLGAVALLAVAAGIVQAGWPARFRVRRLVTDARVREGDMITVTLDVSAETRGLRPRRVLVAADWVDGPDGPVRRPLPELRTLPARVGYELRADRRGVFDIGPLEAGRIDALGLATSVRRHGETTRVLVHPPVHPMCAVPNGAVADPDGRRDAAGSDGLTFHGLREYVPGDDLRRVHWRSSARQGRLMTREHVDTSRPRIVVLVDRRVTGRGKLDEVAAAAASVLVAACRAGLGIELQLIGGRRADGRTGPTAMLDLLAEMTPATAAPVRPGDRDESSAGPPATAGSAHPELITACRLLRLRPAADVVILISAAAEAADLVVLGELRSCYSALIAGLIGTPRDVAVPGLLVLGATDAGDLARRWDRVREWR
ncbi:DUF58 domain-containing protein [Actinomadura chokoriensis]|uniref:DUF58 domain-containing protein n=1 Tax=Actinomadura chokoriensis TaxID=454156 RepID=UPI0031F9CB79